MKPGKNVLAVEARNVGDAPTPAGLIGSLKVIFEQGIPLKLDTDDNWKSATNSAEGWNTAAFDDTTWAMAKSRSEMMEYRPGELSVTKTGGCQPFT